MNHNARLKMIKARSELVLEHPFFAHLALRLEMVEDGTCRSAWSDGRVLAYNPAYVESLSLEKTKGLQCHEVLHLACCHHTRRKGRDRKLWNTACDYAINPLLLEAGLELPTGYLDDPAHHGKSADAIYARLVERDEEIRGGAQSGLEQETDKPDEAEGGANGLDRDEEQSLSGQESSEEEAASDKGFDPGMSGEVRDVSPELDSPEGADDLGREEDSWRMALAQALNKAREAGELPGGLERLVAEALSPTLSWRELLRRFLSDAAKNDFSWVRPDRRHLHAGLYLPSLYNEELAHVAVAVDVSGSITQAEMDSFTAELSAVLEEFDSELTVFTCDAALSSRQRLARWDLPLDFRVNGGGGTDFRPPFAQLHEEGVSPACLIYFTDLECDRFPEEPDYPVLWISPDRESRDHAPPPFGDVVIMERSA